VDQLSSSRVAAQKVTLPYLTLPYAFGAPLEGSGAGTARLEVCFEGSSKPEHTYVSDSKQYTSWWYSKIEWSVAPPSLPPSVLLKHASQSSVLGHIILLLTPSSFISSSYKRADTWL